MPVRLVGDYLVYLAVRILIAVVQALPIEACHAACRLMAVLACDVLRLRGKVVDENLRGAFPDMSPRQIRDVQRQMWTHLLLMVCEIAHVPRKVHRRNWRRHVRTVGIDRFIRALLDRRPAVLLSGHFGNFEAGGYLCGLFGFPTFTIARPLDNPFLDRFVERFRGANGQYILPKTGIAGQVACLLDAGQNLTLLGDQYGGPKGCWVNFFGRPASYHKAIALFSLTSGARMLVISTRRMARPMEFEVNVLGEFDPAQSQTGIRGARDLIQWYNDLLEAIIRRYPEQYWWLHRRWKDPEAATSRRLRKDAPQPAAPHPAVSPSALSAAPEKRAG